MRVLVVGAGLMGAQIGCEYALGGHDVTLTARHPDRVDERLDGALTRAEQLGGLFTPDQVAEGRTRLAVGRDYASDCWDLVVESVPEDFELKIVENRAAAPETVDEILTYGLARRWRNIGFFKAIGGVDTRQRTSANLLPELSAASELPDLRQWTDDPAALADVATRRDDGLARALIEERSEHARR